MARSKVYWDPVLHPERVAKRKEKRQAKREEEQRRKREEAEAKRQRAERRALTRRAKLEGVSVQWLEELERRNNEVRERPPSRTPTRKLFAGGFKGGEYQPASGGLPTLGKRHR